MLRKNDRCSRGSDPATGTAQKSSARSGFTLVELCIVVVVIGILAAIAIPNYARTVDRSRRGACIANQRNLVASAALYVADVEIQNAAINCNTLLTAGYVPARLTECPESGNVDNDDYIVTVVGGQITDVTCTVSGAEHEYAP